MFSPPLLTTIAGIESEPELMNRDMPETSLLVNEHTFYMSFLHVNAQQHITMNASCPGIYLMIYAEFNYLSALPGHHWSMGGWRLCKLPNPANYDMLFSKGERGGGDMCRDSIVCSISHTSPLHHCNDLSLLRTVCVIIMA